MHSIASQRMCSNVCFAQVLRVSSQHATVRLMTAMHCACMCVYCSNAVRSYVQSVHAYKLLVHYHGAQYAPSTSPCCAHLSVELKTTPWKMFSKAELTSCSLRNCVVSLYSQCQLLLYAAFINTAAAAAPVSRSSATVTAITGSGSSYPAALQHHCCQQQLLSVVAAASRRQATL
jgi:hypothetical protein